MAVTDFVRRSMQIVAGGIVGSTTDYFDNAITFVNDVKEVMDMGKQMGSDGAKKFNELRQAGMFKKARDWFYNEGGMFGDFDFDDDMDDGGFEIESADDDRKESEQPLSKQMMTDIAKKQTGAMYKAFGKQADLQIANTAEIVSTINTRTAELTASVNNVNNTLIQIGKRLDLIVEWTSARTKKEQEQERKTSIIDYGGGISLSGLVAKGKEAASDSFAGTMLSIGKNMIGSGMLTPEMVMSFILSQTVLDKKWKGLDNKSINDIGEFINDTVGEVIQNSLTKVLTSKNELLEGLFSDIISKTSGKNYQNSVANQYNDKPAVFDGMTRKSIISIIPGYLNEILKAVSNGDGMNIDHKGNLTARKSNAFVKEISESYFKSGTVGYKERDRAQARTQLSGQEINTAIRTMTGCWTWYMYVHGRNILENGEVKDFGADSTREVLSDTARLLASKTKYTEEEWLTKYLPAIVDSIDEFKYRQELQRTNQRADQNLETFAKTNVNGHLATRITWDVFKQAFEHNYNDFAGISNDGKPGKPAQSAQPTQIGTDNEYSNGIAPIDVTMGILDKLNKGLNVYITGSNPQLQKQPYEAVIVTKGYAKNRQPGASRPGTPTSAATQAAQTIIQPATAAADAERANRLDQVAAANSTGDPRLDELEAKKKRGEKFTKDEQKEYDDIRKNMGIDTRGWLRKQWDKVTGKNDVNYIVDPTMNELSQIFGERLDTIKNSKIVQKIFGSKAGQNVAAGAGATADVIGDAVLGKRGWDQEGNRVRRGGLIRNTAVKADKLNDTVRGGIKSKKRLQEEWEDIAAQYGSNSHFEQGDTDSLNMQLIVSTVNTAMSDGTVSNMDVQTIQSLGAKLSDRDLQRKINQTIIPMMKRNAKGEKDSSGGNESKGKSSLAMLGKIALGLGKMILGPIIAYVKLIGFAVIGIIKGIGGKLMKFLKWGVSSGLRDIVSGFKSMAHGLKTVFAPVSKFINKTLQHATNVINKINGWMSKIGQGISKAFSSIGKLFSRNKTPKASQAQGKPGEMPDLYDTGKKGLFGSMGDRFKNSNFGSGFMKAFNDRKEAQKKATVKEQAAPINQALKDSKVESILQDTTGKKGMLAPVVDALGKIVDKMPDKPKESPGTSTTDTSGKEKDDKSKTTTGATGGQKGGTSTMPDLYAGNKGSAGGGGSTSSMPEVGSARSTDLGGNAGGGSAGGGKGSGGGGAAKGIGETLGGIASSVGGVLKIAITILSFFEAGRALIKFVKNLLIESLKPLNDVIQSIAKVLKPILKQLGGIIKQLAQFIVQVVDVLVDVIKPILEDVIKPILEVISPLLEAILGAIVPILKIVGIVLKVILAPLMGLFKFVLLPILKIIGDAVQIIMGVLQIGFGVLMMGIGGIISAIGGLISLVGKIPLLGAVGNVGEGILNTGKDMMTQGKDFVVQGGKSVAQGAVNLVLDYASLYTLGASDELLGRNQEEDKKETKKIEAVDEDTVKKTVANGDVTNIYNTYGGEYQRGMGGYLNMNQRGCGPIALADMYNRHGGEMSSRSLAGSMYSSGNYDPRRGTSVGGYIDSARSLGMNLTPGKVTQQSLKSASPSNPITVVGSGSDYGTRNGNNHFMNVIGTDHHGGAYVSNPLTGRIDRKPASTIAGGAVMGLYASGDEADGGYSFPDAIKTAFAKLKEEANKILGMFSMEKSDEEETDELINSEKKKNAAEQAKRQLMNDDPDKYAEYEEKAKALALEDFKKKYPKRDNETDEEYQKKFDDWWEGDADQAKYLGEAGVLTEAITTAKGNSEKAWKDIKDGTNSFIDSYAGEEGLFNKMGTELTTLNEATKSLGSSASGNGSGGYFTSQGGNARLALDNPSITDIDMTEVDSSIGDGGGYSHAPVLEFFTKTGGGQSFLYGYNMYNQYGTSSPSDHTKEGVGTAGSSHQGVDLHWKGESAEGAIPVYAPTDGKLELAQPEHLAAGGGNYVSMIDNEGNRHRFMHFHHFSDEIKKMNRGSAITGGKTILGYEGTTGDSTGTHTHWDVYENGGTGNRLNPLTYFSKYHPSSNLAGGTDEEKIWSYLTSNGFEKHAAAGVMGAFQVESANNPDTLEGYYAFGDGSRSNSVVKEAMKNYDTMDDYVVNKLFPMYDRSGNSINKPGYKGTDGHYYPGIGLAQWTGSRTKALSEYTVNKGLGWNDLGGQLDYLKHELDTNSYYSSAVTAMNNSNDVNKSTEIWLNKFEGNPGDKLAERQKYANDFYNRLKDWSPQTTQTFSPTGQGSTATGFGMVNSPGDAKLVDNYNQIKSTSGKNTGTVMTDGSDLNMRADKTVDSSVIMTIPNGTHLNLEVSGSAGWFKTTFGGKTGYVSSEYIALDNDDANNFDYSGGVTDNSTQGLLTAYAADSTGNQQETRNELSMINPMMWDAANWLAPKSDATERKKWYAQLANIHANTIKNSQLTYTQNYKDAWTWNKDDGKRVTPDNEDYWKSLMFQMSADQHFSKLGTGKSDADLTWNGVKDEAFSGGNSTLKKWKNGKDVKAYRGNGVYADAIKTRLNRQLADIKGLKKDWSSWTYGSGDEPMSELDFWNSYLNWNNNSNYVTPGTSDSYNDTGTYWDAETGTTVVNNYQVSRAEDTATDARVRAILANTYNVHSDTMEALLEAILEELQRRRESGGGGNDTNGSTKLFDERIPSQVTKLSIG